VDRFVIEDYARGFIVVDYRAKESPHGVYYYGLSGQPNVQVIGIKPFANRLQAEVFRDTHAKRLANDNAEQECVEGEE
jgi:hypothetical protein